MDLATEGNAIAGEVGSVSEDPIEVFKRAAENWLQKKDGDSYRILRMSIRKIPDELISSLGKEKEI